MAIGLTSLTGGVRLVKAGLFRADQWRISLKWLLLPIGFVLAQWLLVFVLAYLFGSAIQFNVPALSPLHGAIFIFTAFEEIGWRGYALPRLLMLHSPPAIYGIYQLYGLTKRATPASSVTSHPHEARHP